MLHKEPQNTEKYYWTEHVKFKMQYYGISAQRVLGIISKPKRKEEGIVKNTIAVMKPINSKIVEGKEAWKQEIWVMYQKKRKVQNATRLSSSKSKFKTEQLRIISAWRYPGISPERNPIPEDILAEIKDVI